MHRPNRRKLSKPTTRAWLAAAILVAAAAYAASAGGGPALLFGTWLAGAVLLTHRRPAARNTAPARSGQRLAALAACLMIMTVLTQIHAWISQ